MLRAPYHVGQSRETGYLSLLIAAGLIGLLSLLSSCSTIQRHTGGTKDGPPPWPVDISKVKDPVPRCEPKSRCGNQESYVVFGKRYYIQSSSKGYCERGIASWYGMKFHKRRTSNGERFDTTSMTAAHKTLPLPSYAYVTNLENGRRIIVRINDRGPFCDNRIIDLSYVAAVKLGVYPKGTAHVEVKAIDPAEYQYALHHHNHHQPCHPQHSTKHHHHYPTHCKPGHYVELGIYSQEENATKTAEKAERITKMSPHIVANETEEGAEYVVKVGPLKNATQTKQLAKKLKLAGIPTKSTYQN